MPVQTSSPPLPDAFPSFMSVFGERLPEFADKEERATIVKPLRVPTHVTINTSRRPLPFKHRESISSMTSGSTDSSPTTTISTFDPPSAVDTSPSSSPESRRRCRYHILPSCHTPSRRTHVPPKGMRRKPANLTIRTPGFDRSFSNTASELVPPTPHALRHTESSPSLTSVFSPSFGPKGGMQLPRPMTHHGARRPSATSESNFSPLQTVADEGEGSVAGVLPELEEEDDHLESRESTRRSERGYPNGPIQIYDSGVFLYLEPTAQEASQFDVVVNVAKEVTNPFTSTGAGTGTVMSTLRNGLTHAKRLSNGEPWTAASEVSFKSAFEYPPSEASVPATPQNDSPGPEYVHVGWDHNSEILDDLFPLCELIDSRIADGKKVLVHCQLGASRSASLVIAYGLYKNRNLDFNSMYEIVKGRSRWVSPNMSLIYQLTDFRSRLLRGNLSKAAPEEWFVGGPRRSSEPQPPHSGRTDASQASTPGYTSGCSEAGQLSNGLSQASLSSVSVPSTNQGTPLSTENLGFKPLSHKRSLSPRPLPLRQSSFSTGSTGGFVLPESGALAWHPQVGGPFSLAKTDVFMQDGSDGANSLFSPRTNDFMAAPLSRSISDCLEDDGPDGLRFRTRVADPRSPPPGNERLIMRNIDEFL
ncbi:DSPc-domain-containing protein [Aspergillus heteromorphus CBS 117.55]|uniref:protein-tyrosine-phosphatase n=1 Tax=Aspergillus heteromorphus CBS 117.55 TaxID=1448321 RepID=A0A317WXC8_9EURO|nr:DSPc-domain-containing protein [Aspergillus heteromorphus CBS 117.55]PWY91066.1 DSPc-domain-containing protein [Aspergillus heteromorphus CBS 117.55]